MTSQQPDEPTPPDEQPRLEAAASGSGTVFQAGRDQHLHFADGASAATRVRGETVADVCPYPGLAAFGPEQERWFFGRDRATAVLCQRLDAKLAGAGLTNTGPLILIGPSGSGKSSLLRAGLIPALAQGRLPAAGSRSWPHPVLTPTAHPVRALARALSPVTGGEADGLAGAWLASPDECVASVRGALAAARAVILVDQFEEVFTLCTDEPERRAFIDLLDRLAARPADVGPGDADSGPADAGSAHQAEPAALVLISVRADSYADCLRYGSLRAALQASPVLLDPMTAAELRQAILFPAQDVGLEVEPGLIEVLLRDAGVAGDDAGDAAGYPAGRLPLLAHALRATWQEHEGHRLTVHGYQVTGGISNAVATSADREFAGLDEAGQQAARALFLRLVKIGEGTEDVCRRVSRADLVRDIPAEPGGAVLDAFTHARLLTQDQDTVSITHEVLLRAWPRLRTWLDEDRAGNLIRQDLEAAASAWDHDQRPPEALYRGGRLDAARTWARGHDADLTGTGRDFLATSTRQQHRASRLRRGAVAALAVLTMVAVVISVTALHLRSTAVQQRDQAIYDQTVTEALQQSGSDPALAAQLDIAAYRMRPQPAAFSRLINTENTLLPTSVPAGTESVDALAASPRGHLLAGANIGGIIRLWDLARPGHARLLSRFAAPAFLGFRSVWSLAFSPDGRLLAAASLVSRVPALWDVADPAHPRPITLPTGTVRRLRLNLAVAFSPAGPILASGDTDGWVQLWDVADPAHPRLLSTIRTSRSQEVKSVAFSANGKLLAIGGSSGAIRLWNVTDPAQPRRLGAPFQASTGALQSLAFSPTGPTLASADLDGVVKLWDIADPAHPQPVGQPLIASERIADSVAFSPDGSLLAICAGESIQLWDVADPADARLLGSPLITTSTDGADSVAFTPDGHTLASGSDNGTVQLWNLPRSTLTGAARGVASLAFGLAGRLLVSSDGNGRVELWNLSRPGGPRLGGHTGSAGAFPVAFGRGGMLAIGLANGTTLLIDAAEPARRWVLGSAQSSDSVESLAFSPNGRVLASGHQFGGPAQLWNVADPAGPVIGRIPSPAIRGDGAYAMAFSRTGQVLATGGDSGSVQLWDVADPARPRPLGRPLPSGTSDVSSVAISPDGRLLATADDDGTIQLWDMADPARPRPLGRPVIADDSAYAVAFSPNGRTVAAGLANGTILLWRLAGVDPLQQPSQSITVGSNPVNTLSFSPDGRVLASGGWDGGIRLWTLNAGYAIRQICATTAGLTRQQWDRYVSASLPYRPTC